jgi:hypothetical protein
MAPQNISAENSCAVSNMIARNSLKSFGLQFGAIPFDEKYNKNEGKFSSASLSSNIIFICATLLKRDAKKTRKHIYIGSIKVEVNEIFPT